LAKPYRKQGIMSTNFVMRIYLREREPQRTASRKFKDIGNILLIK
jgi:hypothetical protein